MSKNSFAETTNNVKTMLSGLRANASTVARRGLDNEFMDRLEKALDLTRSLDNEQETLKARLKTKTAELEAEVEKLQSLYAEAKKVVKLSVEQSGWLEFGLNDKH